MDVFILSSLTLHRYLVTLAITNRDMYMHKFNCTDLTAMIEIYSKLTAKKLALYQCLGSAILTVINEQISHIYLKSLFQSPSTWAIPDCSSSFKVDLKKAFPHCGVSLLLNLKMLVIPMAHMCPTEQFL